MISTELRDLARGLEEARSTGATEVLHSLLHKLDRLAFESGLIVDFNWVMWKPSGRPIQRPDQEWIEGANIEDLRRFLTCHLQNGRLIEGHLRAAALHGDLILLVGRLGDLLAEDATDQRRLGEDL